MAAMKQRILFSALAMSAGCAASSELAVPNVHTVTPGVLIRGGQPDEAGLVALKQTYGVTTVVNLNDQSTRSEGALCRAAGLEYVALPSNPFHPEREKLESFLRAIEATHGRGAVYVHCAQGMDRTGVAVAAYRIVDNGWSADRANDELRHWQAWPHTLVFLEIPGYVRGIEHDRARWQAATRPTTPTALSLGR